MKKTMERNKRARLLRAARAACTAVGVKGRRMTEAVAVGLRGHIGVKFGPVRNAGGACQ